MQIIKINSLIGYVISLNCVVYYIRFTMTHRPARISENVSYMKDRVILVIGSLSLKYPVS